MASTPRGRSWKNHPVPIVIVSGQPGDQMAATFRAVEAGALAFVPRPMGIGHEDHTAGTDAFIQAVRLMAEVKVVRRWKKTAAVPGSATGLQPSRPIGAYRKSGDSNIVVIGASTGGPVALRTLIAGLPADFPLPILAVQHIAAGFVQGFVDWLALSSQLPIHLAKQGEIPLPGHVYLAPDEVHLGLGLDGAMVLDKGLPENGLRPAVSYLFRTAAKRFGANVIGILLSGMGADGAEELKRMQELGAVTIVQDKESSVVHGMPGVAIALGAAAYILSPEEISTLLKDLTHRRS